MPRPPKNASPLDRLRHYCAYQERCHSEVKAKLRDWEVPWQEHDELVATLVAENYLNELRYAKLYARSKMRQKQWGVQKIKQGLKGKQVSDYCIREALKELVADEYHDALQKAAARKWESLKAETPAARKHKLARFLLSKGFESDAVWETVNRLPGQ